MRVCVCVCVRASVGIVCLLNLDSWHSLFLSFKGAHNYPAWTKFAPIGAMQDMLQAIPLSILQLKFVSAYEVEQMQKTSAVPF